MTTPPPDHIASAGNMVAPEDAAMLDWLNEQDASYGFEETHEGNRWEISLDGPYKTIRDAIRSAMKDGSASGEREG